jgi:hypothetical protein
VELCGEESCGAGQKLEEGCCEHGNANEIACFTYCCKKVMFRLLEGLLGSHE